MVYEILYDKVFESSEQVSVARKLLRKSDTIYPKEYMRVKHFDDFGYAIRLMPLNNLELYIKDHLISILRNEIEYEEEVDEDEGSEILDEIDDSDNEYDDDCENDKLDDENDEFSNDFNNNEINYNKKASKKMAKIKQNSSNNVIFTLK